MGSLETEAAAAAKGKVVVLMVPLPAQGHLNQLINLSRLVSFAGGNDVHVHFACSATHNRQAKLRVHGWDASSPTVLSAKNIILFHDLPFPEISTPPPDPSSPLKFPAHLQPVFDAAVTHLRRPLADLLRSLSAASRRVAVVHDSLMSFIAEDAAGIPNAEAYAFHSTSAFASFTFSLDSKVPADDDDVPQRLKQIYLSSPSPPLKTCFTDAFLQLIHTQHNYLRFDAGKLYNTCDAIEAEFLDYLSSSSSSSPPGMRTWAIGPLNSLLANSGVLRRHKNLYSDHKCMEWLERQPPKSVLYVSFGTMSSMSDEQVRELAKGLRDSNQRFLWVLREPDGGDIFSTVEQEGGSRRRRNIIDLLPDGFKKAMVQAGVGMMVRDWAPQVAILGHAATGGFMTHCGWNSSMESISMGVPVVAWPMASDQPRNETLLTELLKVGVSVRDWARWDRLVPAADIEAAVRRLMESEEGKGMRKRAAELGVAVRKALADGGSSAVALSSFIAHISR